MEVMIEHADPRLAIHEELFLEKKMMRSMVCSICMVLMKDPVMIDNRVPRKTPRDPEDKSCGHTFCRGCVINLSNCPECRKPMTVHHLLANEWLKRQIGLLEVKCKHHTRGCSWRGSVGEEGKDLHAHVKVCAHRGKPCAHCKSLICWEEVSAHDNVCASKPLKCTMDPLCGVMIERGKMDDHIKNRCAYRLVECSFKHLLHESCRAHMHQTDLTRHNDSMAKMHVGLLSATCDRLTAENLELLERVNRADRFIEEQKWHESELKSYKVENSRLTEELKKRPPHQSLRHLPLPSHSQPPQPLDDRRNLGAIPFPRLVPLPGLSGLGGGPPKRRRDQSFDHGE